MIATLPTLYYVRKKGNCYHNIYSLHKIYITNVLILQYNWLLNFSSVSYLVQLLSSVTIPVISETYALLWVSMASIYKWIDST